MPLATLKKKSAPAKTVAEAKPISAPSLLSPAWMQTKLEVGPIGDRFEQEADRTADSVMRMPSPAMPIAAAPLQISRKCAVCEREEKDDKRLQKKSAGPAEANIGEAPASVHAALRSPGQPLDKASRAYFEPRFGQEFGDVRVHTGMIAAQSARDVSAHAYTVGQNIVFAAGRFAPATQTGRRLIAHELTHVVQQEGSAGASHVIHREPDNPEKENPLPLPKGVGGGGPVEPTKKIVYGDSESPLSQKALKYRRAPSNAKYDGGYNLMAVEYRYRRAGSKTWGRLQTKYFWNTPGGGHSEQQFDQHLRNLNKENDFKLEVEVKAIFSERQFCGESSQNCLGLVEKNFPGAKKEFAYNYQDSRNVRQQVAGWIEELKASNVAHDMGPGKNLPAREERLGGAIVKKPEPKKSATTPKKETSGEESDKPTSSTPAAKPADPRKTSQDITVTETKPAKPAASKPAASKPSVPAKPSKPTTASTRADKPAGAPAKTQQTSTSKSPKAPTKATDVPAGKSKGKGSTPSATPTVEPTTRISKPLSATGQAAVKTFNGLVNQYAGKATKIAMSDPQIARTYSDLMRMMDAKALIENPKVFLAQKLANYFLDSAFTALAKQLVEQEVAFWNNYPDVSHFHQIDVGSGQTLDSLKAAYADATRGLQTPDARRVLTTAFVMLGLPENAPQSEIDKRIAAINTMLANQPGVGPFVQRYNEAQQRYVFVLGAVWRDISSHTAMLDQLPKDYFDQIRRRGDALVDTSKILDEFAEKLALLSALPGVDDALWLVNSVAEGVAGLGGELQIFAVDAGQQKRLYKVELDRLAQEIDHINNLHGAFDVMVGRSSPPPPQPGPSTAATTPAVATPRVIEN